MKRRIFFVILCLSVLLCAANIALWIGGYWNVYNIDVQRESWLKPNDVWRNRFATIRMVQGRWLVGWGTNEFHLDHPEGIVVGWGPIEADKFRRDHADPQRMPTFTSDAIAIQSTVPPPMGGVVIGRPDYLLGMRGWFGRGGNYYNSPARTDNEQHAMFPAWLTLIVFLIAPVWYVFALVRARRFGPGSCATCGYDLRASPERCPECGTSAVVTSSAQAISR